MEVLWLVTLSSCSSVVDASLVRFPARYKADDTMVTHGGSKVERCKCVEAAMVSDSSEEDAVAGGEKMEVLVLHREHGRLRCVFQHGGDGVECSGSGNMVKMEVRVSHLGDGNEMMRWKAMVGQFS